MRWRCGLSLAVGLLLVFGAAPALGSESAGKVSPETTAKIEAVEPALEAYAKKGMAAFNVPGAAVGSSPMTGSFTRRVSGCGTQVLGASDWPTAARREILDPLGMHDTSFAPRRRRSSPLV
jgi:hypothetical protein